MIHFQVSSNTEPVRRVPACLRKIGPGTEYPHDTMTPFMSVVECETCRVAVALHNALYGDRCPIKVEG